MKKSMCAKWFEIKLWKKLIILFPITFIIIFVTLFETTPVNLNALLLEKRRLKGEKMLKMLFVV